MRMDKGLYAVVFALALAVNHIAADGEEEQPKNDTCMTEERKTAFHECFDELKNDMMQDPPEDVNEFLCGPAKNKNNLECVIRFLNECPDLVEAPEVKVFKDLKSGLSAKDLLYVDSANKFCKCAPTHSCLMKIDTEKMGVAHADSPWTRLANREYICGIGRKHIDCVATALPACTRYLQYKYNKTMEAFMTSYYDVSGLEYASVFAETHCKNWPSDTMNDTCVLRRSTWYSVDKCYEYALNYKETEDKKCGMHICVKKAMISCPEGSLEFFIDSANVFSEYKIATKQCHPSSASAILASVTSLLVALYVSKLV